MDTRDSQVILGLPVEFHTQTISKNTLRGGGGGGTSTTNTSTDHAWEGEAVVAKHQPIESSISTQKVTNRGRVKQWWQSINR